MTVLLQYQRMDYVILKVELPKIKCGVCLSANPLGTSRPMPGSCPFKRAFRALEKLPQPGGAVRSESALARLQQDEKNDVSALKRASAERNCLRCPLADRDKAGFCQATPPGCGNFNFLQHHLKCGLPKIKLQQKRIHKLYFA